MKQKKANFRPKKKNKMSMEKLKQLTKPVPKKKQTKTGLIITRGLLIKHNEELKQKVIELTLEVNFLSRKLGNAHTLSK